MNVSREYLERCSADTGFSLAALEKVTRLGELAREVGRHALLGEVVVLKGGTVLNLAFGPPTRLSVDLDFNYVGAADRDAMLLDRPRVEKAVAELARRAGYKVQQSADAFAGRKMYLHYRSVLGPEDRIEIDLNYLFRVPIAELERHALWQPGELDRPSVRTVGAEELLAGKLTALLDRCAARDAWDVANLPPVLGKHLVSGSFRSRFVAISGVLDHPLPSYGRDRLYSRITPRTVDENLAPMLARGTAVSAGELVARVWSKLEPLLVLNPDEQRYVEDLDQGLLSVDLLFPGDQKEIDRFARHPALLWKAKNARAHRAASTAKEDAEKSEEA